MQPLPLFSTAYLPSVGYMALLSRYEAVSIEVMETFPKQTFRNRAAIATGGGVQMLHLPVVHTDGNHTRTERMAISYQEPWNIRHWRAIITAYNAAPYFLYYRDGLEQILMQHYDRLATLNDALLHYLTKCFKLPTVIQYTIDYLPADHCPIDYRTLLTCKHPPFPVPMPPYSQVFDDRYGFLPNLSSIDLLFNLGPDSCRYLQRLGEQMLKKG